MLELFHLFWVVQKFRSNARPLNIGLEKNGLNKSNSELSQLFKSVRNLKIGCGLAKQYLVLGHPIMSSFNIISIFVLYHIGLQIIPPTFSKDGPGSSSRPASAG